MTTDEMLLFFALLVCGGACTAIAAVAAIVKKRNEKIKECVLTTSNRYHDILRLNSEYSFFELLEKYSYYREVNSKAKWDRFDFNGTLEVIIQKNMVFFKELVRQTNTNETKLWEYQMKLKNIADFCEKEKIADKKIPYKKYRKFEEKLTEALIRQPVVSPEIIICVRYTSPKGRNSYQKEKEYTIQQIMWHIQKVEEREKIKETSIYQRRKMNDSLRYDVMRRDGFRCVLCGRSAAEDGVKLHVDHIIPVSKGGKTEPGNLRTLCENCNLGKSDKYDPSGLN